MGDVGQAGRSREQFGSYEEYREYQLKDAKPYQDFICEELHRRGIVLQNMTSKQYQFKRENLLGLEIKLDKRMVETGRVYIETAEKAHEDNAAYVLSGIYRNDNSWLYGIGDYTIFYIFSKNTLKRLDQHNPKWLYRPAPTGTSKGFCIPIDRAEKLADRIIRFGGDTANGTR